MIKNDKKRPKLRFPGFTDDWEQRRLRELTDRIIVGLATSVTPYYRETGTPLLRNMNIKENYLDDSDILYLDNEYANSNTGKMIHENDVLTVHTGSNIGLTCIAPKKYDGSLSFTTLITTPTKEKLDSLFLMQYMNCNIGKKSIDALITAGGKPNLNSGDLEKLEVSYPKVDEQKKIGTYFSNLDNLITLHQRKCDQLELLKKGLMQKLFSQEVRFKADDGSEFPEWEKKKIGDIFSKVKDKNKDGQTQNVITNSAEFGLINQRDFFDKNIAVDGKTENYTVIKTGDFVYNPRKSKQAPYGPFNCYRLKEDGIVSPLYTCLRPKVNADDEYLHWYFQSGSWYRFIYENGAQNGARHDRVGMTDSLMQEIPVYLPQAVEEQQKIADCLSSLDEVIEKQKATLAAWKELKKGLLQQMFV